MIHKFRLLVAAIVMLATVHAPGADAAEDADTLAAKIVQTTNDGEKWGLASSLPRTSVVAKVAKMVLVVVDGAQLPGSVERAALDKALGGNLSLIGQDIIKKVQGQVAADK